MTLDEMKQKAIAEVQSSVPNIQEPTVSNVYENVLDDTLVKVTYKDKNGNEGMNHVLFDKGRIKFYRYHSDILTDVSHYKERSWFFRFIQFTGVGGLIALILILFSRGFYLRSRFPVNPQIRLS